MRHTAISLSILIIVLASCIDKFEPADAPSLEGILTVDAVITGGVTTVGLGRTVAMGTEWHDAPAVDDAIVYVECSDGTRLDAMSNLGGGIYEIVTGELSGSREYRLHISAAGKDYESGYLHPLTSPEIDSISWQKDGEGQPVHITLSTHSDSPSTSYYRWTYREDWEFKSELFADFGRLNGRDMSFDINTPNNTFYCWGSNPSRSFVLATTDRLSADIISNKRLISIPASSEKLSELYHIAVSQFRIRYEAYNYFTNLQKNITQSGNTIFAPIPAEMEGNITCITDPSEPVIGYVEVSVPTTMSLFMPDLILAYEPPERNCYKSISAVPSSGIIYILGVGSPTLYAPSRCLDCTERGTKQKPKDWPTPHL
jgi:hypothetical protein